MRLAVSVNFSTGVTVPVVFHSDTWSTNAVIVFVVNFGIVMLSCKRTGWALTLVWLNALLTCQIWEVDEAMCGIDDHTFMFHEVQPYNWSYQTLHHDKMFCKDVVSNVKFKCGCCYRFFYLAICLLNLTIRRFIDFEDIRWSLLFNSLQFFLSYCTNIGSRVNKGIYC